MRIELEGREMDERRKDEQEPRPAEAAPEGEAPTQAASRRTKANLSVVAGCIPRAATLLLHRFHVYGSASALLDLRAGLIERSLGSSFLQDDALHRPVDRLVDLDDLGRALDEAPVRDVVDEHVEVARLARFIDPGKVEEILEG